VLSTEPEADPHSSPYVRVIDSFGEGELDVALVDASIAARAPWSGAKVVSAAADRRRRALVPGPSDDEPPCAAREGSRPR